MEITRDDFETHISSKMNQSLEELFSHVLEMGGLVEKQLDDAVIAIQNNDVRLAKEIILMDKAVNAAEKQIDKLCARVIARQQPAAADLRLIITGIRVAMDLERMGDELVKVSKMVIRYGDRGQKACESRPGYSGLMEILTGSKGMIKIALDSFARVTVDGTYDVVTEEERIDDIYAEANQKVIEAIKQTTSSDEVDCLLDMMNALRACERVSDHVRNIAETVIYLVKGLDVRDLDTVALNKLLES